MFTPYSFFFFWWTGAVKWPSSFSSMSMLTSKKRVLNRVYEALWRRKHWMYTAFSKVNFPKPRGSGCPHLLNTSWGARVLASRPVLFWHHRCVSTVCVLAKSFLNQECSCVCECVYSCLCAVYDMRVQIPWDSTHGWIFWSRRMWCMFSFFFSPLSQRQAGIVGLL